MNKQHVIYIVIGAAILLGWFFRWENVIPNERGAGFYQVNRWTGSIYVVFDAERLPVKDRPVVK